MMDSRSPRTSYAPLVARPWCLSVAMAAVLATPTEGIAATARIVRIDGTTVSGEWVSSPDPGKVRIRTAAGTVSLPLDDLSGITFDVDFKRRNVEKSKSQNPGDAEHSKTGQYGPSAVSSRLSESTFDNRHSTMDVVFYLADGGRLYGKLLRDLRGGDSSGRIALPARTALGESAAYDVDRLAGVRFVGSGGFSRADRLFHAALSARLPGEDVLITRSKDEPRSLRGRLESFHGWGGTFIFGRRTRSFKIEKLFGIVFAAGVSRAEQERYPLTVTLSDGSVFSARIEHDRVCRNAGVDSAAPSGDSLCLATSLGINAAIPLAGVAAMRVHSDRVVYVSDLSPSHTLVEGLLHQGAPGRTPWPVRFDRSVVGGPLSIAGRRFDKGLGVHSRTELTFETGGGFETFAATIGIDDAVRPRGSVAFRLLGRTHTDKAPRTLFDSGIVTGADPPRDVVVDVNGVTDLTLVVDYGDDLDLSDAAVWGNARLIKPRSRDGTGPS